MRYSSADSLVKAHFIEGGPDPESTLAQRYTDEIHNLLAELWTLLPTCRRQTGEETYRLARDNLDVLTTCFNTNLLSVDALGLLRDHLWMLLRWLIYRATKAERQFQHDQDDNSASQVL